MAREALAAERSRPVHRRVVAENATVAMSPE